MLAKAVKWDYDAVVQERPAEAFFLRQEVDPAESAAPAAARQDVHHALEQRVLARVRPLLLYFVSLRDECMPNKTV